MSIPVLAPLTACGGGSSTEAVELRVGQCITGSGAIEAVPCDDPAADYRLVKLALSITDPEPSCGEGEVLLEIQRSFTGGALAGGSQSAGSWCAVPA